jgi:hypothetical protein
MVIANLVSDFSKPYGDYPVSSLFYFGWHILELTLLLALIMHFKPSASESQSTKVSCQRRS